MEVDDDTPSCTNDQYILAIQIHDIFLKEATATESSDLGSASACSTF
jgi:hypothetical protein